MEQLSIAEGIAQCSRTFDLTNGAGTAIWKRHGNGRIVGLGLLYIWGAGIAAWLPLWNSQNAVLNFLSFAGVALVSLSGIAIAIYASNLEVENKSLRERVLILQTVADEYKHHGENALTKLEQERSAYGLPHV